MSNLKYQKENVSADKWYELPFVFADLDPEESRKIRIENQFGADLKILSSESLIDSELNTDSSWIKARFLVMMVKPSNDQEDESVFGAKCEYEWIDNSQVDSGKSY